MSEPYVCALDPADLPARRAQGEAMARHLKEGSRLEGGLELRFEGVPEAERLVEEFVRDERRCCGFFSFATSREGGDIVLRITAPRDPGAQEMVDAALATFVRGV